MHTAIHSYTANIRLFIDHKSNVSKVSWIRVDPIIASKSYITKYQVPSTHQPCHHYPQFGERQAVIGAKGTSTARPKYPIDWGKLISPHNLELLNFEVKSIHREKRIILLCRQLLLVHLHTCPGLLPPSSCPYQLSPLHFTTLSLHCSFLSIFLYP
jgi:hypothetical protein